MFIDQFRTPPVPDASSPNRDSPLRSLAKAISWRITGSLDTIMLAWLFTQQLTVAVSIGVTEVFTKIVLYYFHERAWNRISLGRPRAGYRCSGMVLPVE